MWLQKFIMGIAIGFLCINNIIVMTEQLQTEMKPFCDGDNCTEYNNGSGTYHSCIWCYSKLEPNCSMDPSTLNLIYRCWTHVTLPCFTRIAPNGHTYRGCLYKLPDEVQTKCLQDLTRCSTCFNNNCNRNIFPSDRLRCYHCNSTTDRNCKYNPTVLQPCLIYNSSNSCIAYVENGVTYRGCTSELNCNSFSSGNCQLCEGNGCNNKTFSADDPTYLSQG